MVLTGPWPEDLSFSRSSVDWSGVVRVYSSSIETNRTGIKNSGLRGILEVLQCWDDLILWRIQGWNRFVQLGEPVAHGYIVPNDFRS